MNVCKVPDMCKDMEYKYITEDSKTRVYLSVVREFNEAEYEKYYIRKKKEKVRKRILFIARALKYALPVLATGLTRAGGLRACTTGSVSAGGAMPRVFLLLDAVRKQQRRG